MKIQDAGMAIQAYKELQKISKALSRLDIYSCNYGELSPRQEKRSQKLWEEAEMWAKNIGLKVYHQSDPRGCSLYLIDKTMDNTTYNRGVAIY